MSDENKQDPDEEKSMAEKLAKYGHDPLDDIKPIDADTYEKSKDDTFATPVLSGESQHKMAAKAAPESMLEKDVRIEKVKQQLATEEYEDQVFLGDYFSLTQRDPALRQMIIGAGWEQKALDRDQIDLDLSCFLLDKTDMTREDEDFIFYNNPQGCNGAVKLLEDTRAGGMGDGDDERIFIDINGLPFDILRIVFAISIYDEEYKQHNFSHMRDIYLRVVNYEDNNELARFILPTGDFDEFNGVYMAALVREGPQWFFQPLAEGVKGSLSPIARKYGLIIAEESG